MMTASYCHGENIVRGKTLSTKIPMEYQVSCTISNQKWIFSFSIKGRERKITQVKRVDLLLKILEIFIGNV